MFKGDRNFAVGLFVSLSIAILVAFIIWLTGRTGVEDTQRYSLLFSRDVSGLNMGGPVNYMGVNIGKVVDMRLQQTDDVLVRVDVELLASTPVDSSTFASIAMQGITGVAVINLASDPGTGREPLEAGPRSDYPVIPVREVGFAAIMSNMPQIMSKLDTLLSRAGDILNKDNQALISGTLGNLEQISGALAENREELAAMPGELQTALASIQQTVAEVQALVKEARPQLDSTFEQVNQASANLARLTDQLAELVAQNDDEINRFLGEGLAQTPELVSDARATLRDLQKLLRELQDDPSLLIHRTETSTVEVDP